MRAIEWTSRFKKDYRREKKGQRGISLDSDLRTIIPLLASDELLPEKYRDHALTGDCKDHRDCHIRPDLVLVYQTPDDASLRLVRLGSHSELGL